MPVDENIAGDAMENVYYLQRALHTGKKERAFSRLQKLYDMSSRQSFATDTRARSEFVTKARRLDSLRKEFVESLDAVHQYEYKIDPTYEIDYQSLDSFDDLFCVVEERYADINRLNDPAESPREIRYVPRLEAPKLDVPKFSGIVEEWPVFYQLFKQSVHEDPRYTDLDKVTRLANALQGSARVVLSSISPIAANYNILLQALIDRYEDKRALASVYIDKILNFKTLPAESEKALNSFMEGFIAPIFALKQLNLDDLSDYVLLHIALKKLDPTTARLFENHYRSAEFPSLENLVTFVSEQSKILCRTTSNCTKSATVSKYNPAVNKGKFSTPTKGVSNHAFLAQDVIAPITPRTVAVTGSSAVVTACTLCKEPAHPLYRCRVFRKMNLDDRWSHAKGNRVCFNCLSVNSHLSSACRSSNLCPIHNCNRNHHQLLHRNSHPSQAATPAADNHSNQVGASELQTSSANVVATSSLTSACPDHVTAESATVVLLATAVVVVRDRFGNPQELRCLLDNGSMSHFITKQACERLGLYLEKYESAVHGIGSSPLRISAITTLDFSSRFDENCSYTAHALVVDKLTERLPTARVDLDCLPHLKGVVLADDKFYEPNDIDFLIGAELWPQIVCSRRVLGPPSAPVALKTTLGYIVMGRAPVERVDKSSNRICLLASTSLAELVENFWRVEEVPNRQIVKPEDEKCQQMFLDTTVRNPDGTFTVRLPFAQPPTLLGSSKHMATVRFLSLERSLSKTPEKRNLYVQLIREYTADGTISKIGPLADVADEKSYFIPHHGVYRPCHVSTPLRIVWNASAVTTTSYSLNDLLLTGPKLQSDVLDLLLNFRLFKFAVTADCRRMFLQIVIDQSDRRYQRFIWREEPGYPLDVYESNKVIFGMSCSPFLAQATVRLLADLERDRFPLAAAVVDRDLYVDDVTSSINDEEGLIELHRQLEAMFKSGGFTLAKWCSNSALLMEQIPKEFRLSTLIDFDADGADTKVLGVRWLPSTDNLIFVASTSTEEDIPCTKRNMLSVLARIYDPLGLIAPITVVTKILLKDTWEKKIDWDVTPPPAIVQRWDAFKRSLSDLKRIKFPRHVGVESGTETVLVGFSDSSEKAYGACVYVRTESKGEVRVNLLCAKSHVAPSKVRGIPRLELCGAVLLAKLMRYVIDSYTSRHSFAKIIAFSDSQVALHWIHSEPHKWKTWVANRIAYVQDQVEKSHWRHVAGDENPADIVSRGTDTDTLLNHHLWFHGPPWLKLSEEFWPPPFMHQTGLETHVANEAKMVIAFPVVSPPTDILAPLLDRISSYRKLLRTTAYVFRACTKTNLRTPYILKSELQRAEKYWVQYAQSKDYAEQIALLQSGKPLRATDGLRHLDPFYENGLLRVGGRLAHAKIPFDQKHPILLPTRGKLVDLIIDQYHLDLMHAGAHSLLTMIRLKFWIPAARTRIRSRVRKCNPCFRVRPEPNPPKMADLPQLRVTGCRAFEKVGCDYAGPFMIVTSRQRGKPKLMKSYFCLFICLSVKAVHIELCSDLTTECFLAAFKRFLSRRGPCSFILSDGGSTFVGARRRLSEMEEFITTREFEAAVGNELASRGIEWRFNPPCGPSWGGLWESNVKTIKSHLKRCIGNQYLTYEEFNTVLIQIEAVLNSRPLCTLSNEPSAPAALTPSHFLTLGSTLEYLPALDVTYEPLNRLQRYELVDRIVQDYWRRWSLEYVRGLQSRSKWRAEVDPIEKGTVVLILDEKLPPLKWPLGIIEDIYPGIDGTGRSVRVRTQTGIYKRPVVKICPLPTQ